MAQGEKVNRLRAPRENRAILAEPPLHEVGALLAGNEQLFQQPLQFFGLSWLELRRQAARSALTAATKYLQDAGEPVGELPLSPCHLLLAGHQPELFHPGVWVKNFALYRLARQHGAVPLNLVVDSDTAKPAMLHLPEGDHLASVPFDHWQADVPYEERRVDDEKLFASLPARTASLTQTWPFVPMLADFWQEVLRQKERTPFLGERLAAARRAWERRWGFHNLEVPVSKLCQTEPFAWFACHLLHDLPRFHAIYNQAVQEYRREHGIRSRFHPVPDLAQAGAWLEAPFWIWIDGQSRRERLFIRLTAAELQLRCGAVEMSLPRPGQSAPEATVARWLELERRGIKIRTRALTTTMFARLLLGDAFVHGIGGAKYDELTDVLIQRFHGIRPPHYLVVSATLLLPVPHSPTSGADVRRLARERRDAWWNPQRHFRNPAIDDLARLRQTWIDRSCATAAERLGRFLQLRKIGDRMRGLVKDDFQNLTEALVQSRERLAVNQVLERRDYAFCLYPEEELRQFMMSVGAI
jgi:hypothetical protein